jgi:peptidoglycan/LPS O-acetylase OafA/YrhL
MKYRREIDGLRAIAVLPVIFFHTGFKSFSGGFVGVDVFFVISGYLITTIILAELEREKFSLVNFYERRARRILPALFTVMLVCVPLAWTLLSPADLKSFSKSLVAVSSFVSNIFFWRDGGYFETATEMKPLLHTWSLAVEEQYYVIFPLFLVYSWQFGKRWIQIALASAFVASLSLAQWGAYAYPGASFYLLPTRAWELLCGAFAALYLVKNIDADVRLSEVAGWLGVALILFAVFMYDSATPFPGVYAAAPTLGAVLIILFANQRTSAGKLIGNKVLVGIGLISYSAYLWHQPVLAFARHWTPEVHYMNRLLLIAVVGALSVITWKYVEHPFRTNNLINRKHVFAGSIVGPAFFIFTGYLSSKINLNQEEAMAKELSVSDAIYSSNINERVFIKNRILYENGNPEALVIGSSRIMQARGEYIGLDILNLSVSGASLEDLLAIWELSSRKFKPRYVFLGADPWIFNRNSDQNRWISLSAEYSMALAGLGISKSIHIDSVNPPSSFDLIATGFYNSVNQRKITSKDDVPGLTDKIRKDGSRVYNTSYANKSASEVEKGASKFASYAMSDYSFSKQERTILEMFLLELKRKEIAVFLVLSPYHPQLYDLMRLEDRKFLEIESIFREIAALSGATVIGSYDPVRCGCSSEEFYDGMHPKDSCMEKIFARWK